MGSYLSAEKSAAKKTGCTLEEWRARRADGTKWCFRCRRWHPIELFSVDRSRKGGRTSSCKACTSIASTASRYGKKPAEVRALLLGAGGRCQLCKAESAKLVIDHSHATGAIRGILCSACNVGLGLFGDDPAALREAAAYLEKHDG